jgi:hypothetical protein
MTNQTTAKRLTLEVNGLTVRISKGVTDGQTWYDIDNRHVGIHVSIIEGESPQIAAPHSQGVKVTDVLQMVQHALKAVEIATNPAPYIEAYEAALQQQTGD